MFSETYKRKLFIRRAKRGLLPVLSKRTTDTCGLHIRSPMANPATTTTKKVVGEGVSEDARGSREVETSTDFPFPDIPFRKYKFRLKENESHCLIPTSLTPALPCYTHSSPKSRKTLSPLLPHSFQNYSLKSVSPITLLSDFEMGRAKSSSKDSLKVYIQKMKTIKTPKACTKKLEVRQKYFKNIHLRSVLKNIRS